MIAYLYQNNSSFELKGISKPILRKLIKNVIIHYLLFINIKTLSIYSSHCKKRILCTFNDQLINLKQEEYGKFY